MPERITAWDDPTWVLAVMHYPTDTLILDRIAAGKDIDARRGTERAIQGAAARAGKTAGNVLAALYVLAYSRWRVREPSLARAIYVAEILSREDGHPGAPAGHTKIEECFYSMRPVAHLWAAFRLYGGLLTAADAYGSVRQPRGPSHTAESCTRHTELGGRMETITHQYAASTSAAPR